MTKVRLEIEGQLCDLADLFAALATAATPRQEHIPVPSAYNEEGEVSTAGNVKFEVNRPATSIHVAEHTEVSYGREIKVPAHTASLEQEDPEQTDADGKPRRKRRTKEQIEADRLAAEQVAQESESYTEEARQATPPARTPDLVDLLAQPAGEVNGVKMMQVGNALYVDNRSEETDQTADFPTMVKINAEHVVTSNHVAVVEIPPANPLLTGINFDGPYIETMRKASQLMIAKNAANKDLILDLLNEFSAKGLSEVKDEDKAAFKIRFKELPFKG